MYNRRMRSVGWLAAVVGCLLLAPETCRANGGWHTNFAQAEALARQSGKPLLIHFHASWCGPCRQMEREVLNTAELKAQLGETIIGVKVDSDEHPELVSRFSVRALPADVFVDPYGKELARSEGYTSRQDYLGRIARVDAQFQRARRVRIATDKPAPAPDEDKPSIHPKSDFRRPNPEAPRDLITDDSPPSTEPVVGLEGYSPVALWNSRQWRKGRPDFAVEHKGITYWMTGDGELRQFRANPQRYVPRLLGCDPVVLWKTDRAIPGIPHFGAYYNGELFLFVDGDSRQQFKADPGRYTRTRHVLRPDQIERTTLR
jgi:thiol-disulfide isomerase/thioredoxin